MPACSNCDEYVTRDFIRVFGIEGEVHGCPQCSTYRDLHDGAGTMAAGSHVVTPGETDD